MNRTHRLWSSLGVAIWIFLLAPVAVRGASPLELAPFHASGIYGLGQKVGWTVKLASPSATAGTACTYTIKQNDFNVIQSGPLDLSSGPAVIETSVDQPAMLYLEIRSADPKAKPVVAGAAVDPTQLQPSVPCPADFDAFWQAKIALLHSIPANPVLTPEDSGRPGVTYATIRMNNIHGAHIYGQIAQPAKPGKYPAMLIMQWAGGPYPLRKEWVTGHAAEGWIAFNVEPHDVPGNMPAAFYADLPQMIKSYTTIYDDDRDRNYFLRMYLGDYRALDYLAALPDWDGKILLVTGTSMGGQQSFCVAGLHPKVTHLIVHVPAGADSNAALHGRAEGYPNWDSKRPKVMETALYFDTVNFAARIKAKCLVSMGFVDTTAVPAGIWTAFNQIRSPKEAVPLIDSPHNNFATAEQQHPYFVRSAEWLKALVHDQEPAILPLSRAVAKN